MSEYRVLPTIQKQMWRLFFVSGACCAALIMGRGSIRATDREPTQQAEAAQLERSPEVLAMLLEQRDQLQAERKALWGGIDLATVTAIGPLSPELEAFEKDYGSRMEALNQQIDQVGGQKYCSASRLFWYTDLEQAKQAAQRSGKPILSLRLLGKLTEELSCANSRFFRTTLYANTEISRVLRENFVLHWESVRPVPVMTIDFGDGRKLVRTVTGNSIHYVLAPNGDVVDALPGLFGPPAFLAAINRAGTTAREIASLPKASRRSALSTYHAQCVQELTNAWEQDLQTLADAGGEAQIALQRRASKAAAGSTEPTDLPRVPCRRSVQPVATIVSDLEARTTESLWTQLAILHGAEAQLDRQSMALIKSQFPSARMAGRVAISKGDVEMPLVRMLRSFTNSIAEDSIRNQYLLHRQLHEWFTNGEAPPELNALNEKIYAKLFLTPSNDPWLGLMPANTYSGLSENGVVATK